MEKEREMAKEKEREMEDAKMGEMKSDEVKVALEGAAAEEAHDGEDGWWEERLAVSSDGKVAIMGNCWGDINMWSLDGPEYRHIGEVSHGLECHGRVDGCINFCAFYPRRNDFAFFAVDSMVVLWNLRKERSVREFRNHAEDDPSRVIPEEWEPDDLPCVSSLAVSSDGKTLATGSAWNVIRLWNVESGRCTAVLRGHTQVIRCLHFTPDGKRLVSSAADRTVRIWDVAECICTNIFGRLPSSVTDMSFIPNSSCVMACADDKVYLMDLTSGRYVVSGEPLPSPVISVEVCPIDSAFYCVGTASDGVFVREMVSGQSTLGQLTDCPLRPGQVRSAFRHYDGSVEPMFARWTPDGKYVVHTVEDTDIELKKFRRRLRGSDDVDMSNSSAKK